MRAFLIIFAWFVLCFVNIGECVIPKSLLIDIDSVNNVGSYIGIVVPNSFEMNPLLQSSSFVKDQKRPYLDVSGRRFRIGTLEHQKVIIVMTGLSMLNAGITTQLLSSLFNVKGVLHFGIAGNANTQLEIGDVTIPEFWAHTSLWSWQRYGEGPENELPLESNGDYTKRIGYLKFSDYNNDTSKQHKEFGNNLLNRVWYQPEEVFPISAEPEVRQRVFWVPVDKGYYALSKKLKGLKLENCINSTTCLPREPKVARVKRGASANMFIDNGAYRKFLSDKFNVTTIDMESAAVALICYQQKIPFIAIRALSDFAGGGSAISNEAANFAPLAAQNAVIALIKFVQLLHSY
ncbi:bark storage protein A-like [Rutidosis leptorrhynchoides]|uniref:bark storage protein A-like n=1 Tax=Rutidosis leptorrhynchoides TaxID=125765 RepID=UPI003A99373B